MGAVSGGRNFPSPIEKGILLLQQFVATAQTVITVARAASTTVAAVVDVTVVLLVLVIQHF